MNTIEERINDLKKYLYFDNIESNDIDKINIQKSLFKLLRECIKNQIYEIEVGSFCLNITPSNLSVVYETEDITIEVSNEDAHSETLVENSVEYFCISKEQKEEYSITTPAIRAIRNISVYDDTIDEIYEMVISDDIDDDIRKYIQLKNGFMFFIGEFDTKYRAYIRRTIKRETPYLEAIDLLNTDIVKPVTYIEDSNKYIHREIKKEKDYTNIIPSLHNKKLITSYLYGLIVEFYTDYMNEHNS